MRIHIRVLCFVVLGAFGCGAVADPSPWYLGVSASSVDYGSLNGSAEKTAVSALAPDAGPTSASTSASGRSLLGGYQWNDWFSVEAGYFDLGSTSFLDGQDDCCSLGQYSESLTGKLKLTGESVEAVFQSPPHEFFVFGKLGLARTHLDEALALSVFSESPNGDTYTKNVHRDLSSTGTTPEYGIGVGYATDGGWIFRVGHSWLKQVGDDRTGKGNVGYSHVDVLYRF